ncbi:MAG: flavin reductase family protein [Dehalococcoidales bacterium]|nr:flavin reductase family protein [Dehalococcoidales bacterium]
MGKTRLSLETGLIPILTACPTVLAGSMLDGKVDFVTVAWTGVAASIPPSISIALQHHRYSLKGIRQNMSFSVNIPSIEQVKETDYCGIVSGAKRDKTSDCQFSLFYGNLQNAPLISQCPVNHACKVIQILDLGSHELVIGRIVETFVSEECLTGDRPDALKIRPFLFANGNYYSIGEHLGDAFSCGRTINESETSDAIREFEKHGK